MLHGAELAEKEDEWTAGQPWYLKLLVWECEDECKYSCMWDTVDNFRRDGRECPQFYGKVRDEGSWLIG